MATGMHATQAPRAVHSAFDRGKLIQEARRAIPVAFDAHGRLLSPTAAWTRPRDWQPEPSPVDGQPIAELPTLDTREVASAVTAAAREFAQWAPHPLSHRADIVRQGVASLKRHHDLLVRILGWEIGKTPAAAETDVDRCLQGIDWYLEQIGPMLEGQTPLGVVSNVASWNYPFSVLLLNVLVQALAGNAAIAKIPTQGGGISLTLAFAILRHEGLPVSLVGGRGRDLTEPLIAHPDVAAVAFVGGRENGGAISKRLRGSGKRYALEMEGINAYAITRFSDWAALEKQIRTGFDFGKQRCTAYTRWVVERSLVPSFVDTWLRVAKSLRVGHPYIGLPTDFGPLISAEKVDELHARIEAAQAQGADVIHRGALSDEAFLPGQDRRAYLAPVLLQRLPPSSDLYLREPFGPVDVLAVVDDDDQLIAEANVSGGALVASVATDDPEGGARLASRLMAFKVGVNRLRSRGDKEETFGGRGRSWEGAFVGGSNLVQAFTRGPSLPPGNWPDDLG